MTTPSLFYFHVIWMSRLKTSCFFLPPDCYLPWSPLTKTLENMVILPARAKVYLH